jgi:formylmethanofuran dehydrogenase subunit E
MADVGVVEGMRVWCARENCAGRILRVDADGGTVTVGTQLGVFTYGYPIERGLLELSFCALLDDSLPPRLGMLVDHDTLGEAVIVDKSWPDWIMLENEWGQTLQVHDWRGLRVAGGEQKVNASSPPKEGMLLRTSICGTVEVVDVSWLPDNIGVRTSQGEERRIFLWHGLSIAGSAWRRAREPALMQDVYPEKGMVIRAYGDKALVVRAPAADNRNMRVRLDNGAELELVPTSEMAFVEWGPIMAEDFTFMRPCEECGEPQYSGDLNTIDGRLLCKECLEDKYSCCEECGEWTLDSEMLEGMCLSCYEEKYASCADCGATRHIEEMREHEGEWFCEECFWDRFSVCDGCGDAMEAEYAFYDEESDRTLCQCCYDDLGRTENHLHFHSYKPSLRFHSAMEDEAMHYGIELEMECKNSGSVGKVASLIEDMYESDWCLKEDGSLTCGIEVATQPRTFKSWQEFFPEFNRRVLAPAKGNGCTAHDNGNCGIHIHTSLDAWEGGQLVRLFELMYDPRNYGNILKISQRTKDKLNQWASLSMLDIRADKRRIESKLSPFPDKYAALNITDTTLEVRIFRSNLRLDRVRKNLEFVHALYCYTKERKKRVSWPGLTRWICRHKKEMRHLLEFMEGQGMLAERREAASVDAA